MGMATWLPMLTTRTHWLATNYYYLGGCNIELAPIKVHSWIFCGSMGARESPRPPQGC